MLNTLYLLSQLPKDITGETDTDRAIDRAFAADIRNANIDGSASAQIKNVFIDNTLLPYWALTGQTDKIQEYMSENKKVDMDGGIRDGALEEFGNFVVAPFITYGVSSVAARSLANVARDIAMKQAKKNLTKSLLKPVSKHTRDLNYIIPEITLATQFGAVNTGREKTYFDTTTGEVVTQDITPMDLAKNIGIEFAFFAIPASVMRAGSEINNYFTNKVVQFKANKSGSIEFSTQPLKQAIGEDIKVLDVLKTLAFENDGYFIIKEGENAYRIGKFDKNGNLIVEPDFVFSKEGIVDKRKETVLTKEETKKLFNETNSIIYDPETKKIMSNISPDKKTQFKFSGYLKDDDTLIINPKESKITPEAIRKKVGNETFFKLSDEQYRDPVSDDFTEFAGSNTNFENVAKKFKEKFGQYAKNISDTELGKKFKDTFNAYKNEYSNEFDAFTDTIKDFANKNKTNKDTLPLLENERKLTVKKSFEYDLDHIIGYIDEEFKGINIKEFLKNLNKTYGTSISIDEVYDKASKVMEGSAIEKYKIAIKELVQKSLGEKKRSLYSKEGVIDEITQTTDDGEPIGGYNVNQVDEFRIQNKEYYTKQELPKRLKSEKKFEEITNILTDLYFNERIEEIEKFNKKLKEAKTKEEKQEIQKTIKTLEEQLNKVEKEEVKKVIKTDLNLIKEYGQEPVYLRIKSEEINVGENPSIKKLDDERKKNTDDKLNWAQFYRKEKKLYKFSLDVNRNEIDDYIFRNIKKPKYTKKVELPSGKKVIEEIAEKYGTKIKKFSKETGKQHSSYKWNKSFKYVGKVLDTLSKVGSILYKTAKEQYKPLYRITKTDEYKNFMEKVNRYAFIKTRELADFIIKESKKKIKTDKNFYKDLRRKVEQDYLFIKFDDNLVSLAKFKEMVKEGKFAGKKIKEIEFYDKYNKTHPEIELEEVRKSFAKEKENLQKEIDKSKSLDEEKYKNYIQKLKHTKELYEQAEKYIEDYNLLNSILDDFREYLENYSMLKPSEEEIEIFKRDMRKNFEEDIKEIFGVDIDRIKITSKKQMALIESKIVEKRLEELKPLKKEAKQKIINGGQIDDKDPYEVLESIENLTKSLEDSKSDLIEKMTFYKQMENRYNEILGKLYTDEIAKTIIKIDEIISKTREKIKLEQKEKEYEIKSKTEELSQLSTDKIQELTKKKQTLEKLLELARREQELEKLPDEERQEILKEYLDLTKEKEALEKELESLRFLKRILKLAESIRKEENLEKIYKSPSEEIPELIKEKEILEEKLTPLEAETLEEVLKLTEADDVKIIDSMLKTVDRELNLLSFLKDNYEITSDFGDLLTTKIHLGKFKNVRSPENLIIEDFRFNENLDNKTFGQAIYYEDPKVIRATIELNSALLDPKKYKEITGEEFKDIKILETLVHELIHPIEPVLKLEKDLELNFEKLLEVNRNFIDENPNLFKDSFVPNDEVNTKVFEKIFANEILGHQSNKILRKIYETKPDEELIRNYYEFLKKNLEQEELNEVMFLINRYKKHLFDTINNDPTIKLAIQKKFPKRFEEYAKNNSYITRVVEHKIFEDLGNYIDSVGLLEIFKIDKQKQAIEKIASMHKGYEDEVVKEVSNDVDWFKKKIFDGLSVEDAKQLNFHLGRAIYNGLHRLDDGLEFFKEKVDIAIKMRNKNKFFVSISKDMDSFLDKLGLKDDNKIRNILLKDIKNYAYDISKNNVFNEITLKKKLFSLIKRKIRNSEEESIYSGIKPRKKIIFDNLNTPKAQLFIESNLAKMIAKKRIEAYIKKNSKKFLKNMMLNTLLNNKDKVNEAFKIWKIHEATLKDNGSYNQLFGFNPEMKFEELDRRIYLMTRLPKKSKYTLLKKIKLDKYNEMYMVLSDEPYNVFGKQDSIVASFTPDNFSKGIYSAKVFANIRFDKTKKQWYYEVTNKYKGETKTRRVYIPKDSNFKVVNKHKYTELQYRLSGDEIFNLKLYGLHDDFADASIATMYQRNIYLHKAHTLARRYRSLQMKILQDARVVLNKAQYLDLDPTLQEKYIPFKTMDYGTLYIQKRFKHQLYGTRGFNLNKLTEPLKNHPELKYFIESKILRSFIGLAKILKGITINYNLASYINSGISSYITYALSADKPQEFIRNVRQAKRLIEEYKKTLYEYTEIRKEIQLKEIEYEDVGSLKEKLNEIEKKLKDNPLHDAFENGLASTLRQDALNINAYKENELFKTIRPLFRDKQAYEFMKVWFGLPDTKIGAKLGEYFDNTEMLPKLALYLDGLNSGLDRTTAAQRVIMHFPNYGINLPSALAGFELISPYMKYAVNYPKMMYMFLKRRPNATLTLIAIQALLPAITYSENLTKSEEWFKDNSFVKLGDETYYYIGSWFPTGIPISGENFNMTVVLSENAIERLIFPFDINPLTSAK